MRIFEEDGQTIFDFEYAEIKVESEKFQNITDISRIFAPKVIDEVRNGYWNCEKVVENEKV